MRREHDEDYIVFEGSGLRPTRDGYVDEVTGHFISNEGIVYDKDGEVVDDMWWTDDEYDDQTRD